MNLKLQQVDWDEKDLMYVEFVLDGKRVRWYPKWKEIDSILHFAWLTEGEHSWNHYFDVMVTEIAIRNLVRRIVPGGPSSPLMKVDVRASQLFQELRKLSLPGGKDAKT